MKEFARSSLGWCWSTFIMIEAFVHGKTRMYAKLTRQVIWKNRHCELCKNVLYKLNQPLLFISKSADLYLYVYHLLSNYEYYLISLDEDNQYTTVLTQNNMVCEKCEKKLSTVITQDPWKVGARNTLESGGRKLNENKLLTQSSKTKAASGSSDTSRHQFRDCGICKAKCHQVGSYYCQHCAYKKGICSMCGIKIANTRDYNQSSA